MNRIKINEKDTYHLLTFLTKYNDTIIVDTIHIKKIYNRGFIKPHFIYTDKMDYIVKDENWITTHPDKIKLQNILKKLARKEKITRILKQDFNI